MEDAILNSWLTRNDILVCDNASLHAKGYNSDLAEWLWNVEGYDGRPLNILLMPLPSGSPELNPIELVWNTIVIRLKGRDIDKAGGHVVAKEACRVMDEIDLQLVVRTYRHCGLKI